MVLKSILFLVLGTFGLLSIPPIYFLNQAPKIDKKIMIQTEIAKTTEPSIVIKGKTVRLELVQTTEAVQKGLSGRSSLESDKGLFFIFPKSDYHAFWMPDMNFPIDIIWIDEFFRIVDIAAGVPPLADKKSPVYYLPKSPARYALEVNSGLARKYKWQKGDGVLFKDIIYK